MTSAEADIIIQAYLAAPHQTYAAVAECCHEQAVPHSRERGEGAAGVHPGLRSLPQLDELDLRNALLA
jgi:hypothetical protein